MGIKFLTVIFLHITQQCSYYHDCIDFIMFYQNKSPAAVTPEKKSYADTKDDKDNSSSSASSSSSSVSDSESESGSESKMAKGISSESPSKISEVMEKWFGKNKRSETTSDNEVRDVFKFIVYPFYLSKKHEVIIVGIRHKKPGNQDIWNFKPEYVVKALHIYKTEFMSKSKDVFKNKLHIMKRYMLRDNRHGSNKIKQTWSINFNRHFQTSFLAVFLEKHPFNKTFQSSVQEFANCFRAVLRTEEFKQLYRGVVSQSATPNMGKSLESDDSELWKGFKKAEIVVENEKHLDAMFMDDDIEDLLQTLWNTDEINDKSSKKILRSGWKNGKLPKHLKHDDKTSASKSDDVKYGSDSDDATDKN